MTRLSTRLAKLEGVAVPDHSPFLVSVVRAPFPEGDEQEWAQRIVERLGCAAAVWVLEGADFEVLLPPTLTSKDAMPYGGEAERQWCDSCTSYPHWMIIGNGAAGMLVQRFESAAHEREWNEELVEELGSEDVRTI